MSRSYPAEATGDLIGNKVADKIARTGSRSYPETTLQTNEKWWKCT